MSRDPDDVNFLGDRPPCVYCGYQSCNCPQCTCFRLPSGARPCPGCRRHSALMADRKFRRLPDTAKAKPISCDDPMTCPCPGCQRYRTDVIDVPNCAGQTLDPPCGCCARCMEKAFAHEPLDVLALDQDVLFDYPDTSYAGKRK